MLPNQLNATPHNASTPNHRVFNFDNSDLWSSKNGSSKDEKKNEETAGIDEEINIVIDDQVNEQQYELNVLNNNANKENETIEALDEGKSNTIRKEIKSTSKTRNRKKAKKENKIITMEDFPLDVKRESPIPHPPPTTATTINTLTVKKPKNRNNRVVPEKTTTKTRRRKQYFCIWFRWPCKVFTSILLICTLALAILNESYAIASFYEMNAIELDTSELMVTQKDNHILKLPVNPSIQYLTSSTKKSKNQINVLNQLNESLYYVICEYNSNIKSSKESCYSKWNETASTSILFNTSLIGWNVNLKDLLPSQQHAVFFVWNESVESTWVVQKKNLTHWIILFSILLVFITIWFINQVIQNERHGHYNKKTKKEMTQENILNIAMSLE
jgi:hypothetical protein